MREKLRGLGRRPIVKLLFAAIAVVALATCGIVFVTGSGGDYQLQVVMDSAVGVVNGTPVQVDGLDVGTVIALAAKGDVAVATISLSGGQRPLHAGTTVAVEWRSVLGERYLRLQPGSAGNGELPSGAMIQASPDQVTVDDVLQTVDAPTRAHLTSVIAQLRATLSGHEQSLNDTLRTAGPTVQALGEVFSAVGGDGPAIRELITNASNLTAVLAQRKDRLAGTIGNLDKATETVAAQQQQLSAGMAELPSTLDSVQGALDRVPAATDATVPLLQDLAPAAARLPAVAANLAPVLRDLQPTIAQLRPTLDVANTLLGNTPGLLDNAQATLPGVTQALRSLAPAVTFLRPYTPEIMGAIDNWGNVYSAYTGEGHTSHLLVSYGGTILNNQPLQKPVGGEVNLAPPPGYSAGKPWTDANGSQPR
jgi:phospholipid/cholesterol/gamma-HCH transport system substrate-binding protein